MSFIKIQCENDQCNKIHTVNSADFDFETIGSEERQMGPEVSYSGELEIQCDCGNVITIEHTWWEYPVGAENYKETNVSGAEIIENTL